LLPRAHSTSLRVNCVEGSIKTDSSTPLRSARNDKTGFSHTLLVNKKSFTFIERRARTIILAITAYYKRQFLRDRKLLDLVFGCWRYRPYKVRSTAPKDLARPSTISVSKLSTLWWVNVPSSSLKRRESVTLFLPDPMPLPWYMPTN